MLACTNLVKRYRGLNAVDGVTMELSPGHIYMLLGPNGSGKSTFMKVAAGLIHPTSGEITFQDKPIGSFSKAHIAYMPTESFFYPYMTWKDAGNYYRDFYEDFDMDLYAAFLEEFHLDLKQKISKMSSGMTAKGKVALTLARRADLCMLDEPLNGIDIIARDQILDAIRKSKRADNAFLISSHLVEELERMSDEAVFMKDGMLVLKGGIEEIRAEKGMDMAGLYKEIYRDKEMA